MHIPQSTHVTHAAIPRTVASPYAPLVRLYEISRILQRDYREQSLNAIDNVYQTTLSGIDKERAAQKRAFQMQISANAISLAGGLAFSAASFAPNIRSLLNSNYTVTDEIMRQNSMLVQSGNTAIQGLSGTLSTCAQNTQKMGELDRSVEQAKATRQSQRLDLSNNYIQEQSANLREIRDTIRTIAPIRSFHA